MDLAVEEMIAKFGVTDDTRRFLRKRQLMFINGAFTDGQATAAIDNLEPSTGTRLGQIPAGTAADLDSAVSAARGAVDGGAWSKLKPNERQRLLLSLADAVEANARTIGEIETLDNGKALGPCIEMDVLGSADLLRFMAGFATKIEGATRDVSAPGDNFAMTLKEPVGVVGAIVPWNWPLNMATWKLAAPLAAGCSVVLKPAQQTSLSVLYLAELAQKVGLPEGALNIVTGTGAMVGQALASHAGVDKVSFTGSTAVGRRIGSLAGESLKPVTLELGGKSPMIAFEDADIEALAEAMRWSIFFNAGQVCSGGSRLYAHRKVFDQAVDAVAAVARSMKLRPGLDPECDMGPVISREQQASILGYIAKGKSEGAQIVCGGSSRGDKGYFVEPTLLTAQNNHSTVVQEEIFGPVLVALPFDDEDEALRNANDNAYGLGASVWTRDISRALRISKALKAGSVWINTHDLVDSAIPFGGAKASGFGKDMGREQFESCLRTKSLWIRL
jgi:phenylacetaldehyde dehydrogenase